MSRNLGPKPNNQPLEKQVIPKVIWEERVAIHIGYNGTLQIHLKTVPSPSTITTPSSTPIPRPTPLTTLNGIRIQSAILPQCTFQTGRPRDGPTDGIGDNSVCFSVCSHNSRTTRPNFTKCVCVLPVAVARSSSDGVAISDALPVLWMTSCFSPRQRKPSHSHDQRTTYTGNLLRFGGAVFEI